MGVLYRRFSNQGEVRESEVRSWPPTPGATARQDRRKEGKSKAQDGKQPSGQQTHQPAKGRKESVNEHGTKTRKKILSPGLAAGARREEDQLPGSLSPQASNHVETARALS